VSEQNPTIDGACAGTTGYPPEAYRFVREGLDHTANALQGERDSVSDVDSRNVSGQQLCLGLRDFAIRQYGLMAGLVLRTWNVRRTEDFGRIVYDMVESGVLHKTEDDAIEDFADVFSFDEAFASPLAGGATRRSR